MRFAIVVVLVGHALIHVMGFAKAFGFADLPRLHLPIPRSLGLAWLAAAVLVLAAAWAFAIDARWFWIVGAFAVIVSQAVICTAWGDAKFGTVANAFLALLVLQGLLLNGPGSLRAHYDRDVASRLARVPAAAIVSDGDLSGLPPAIQRYLRLTGAVGQPHVRDFRVRFGGRIRGGPRAAWMPFVADQTSFDDPPARFFLMKASMFGAPVVALHRYVGPTATMQVKIAGAVTIVNAAGPKMDQGETVTLFNDMCLLAPATLLDPAIQWTEAGPDTVRATFTNAGNTIRAELVFNAAGELVNFVSDDRFAASPDGKSFTAMRWTTPVGGYRAFGRHRLFANGEARWHAPEGEFAYVRLELLDIEYNVARE